MKEFLIANWKLIVVAIAWVLNFMILILKKNHIITKDTPFEVLVTRLPEMICNAELTGLNGNDKKVVVLTASLTWISSVLGIDAEEAREKYGERISKQIEAILATPQKKGN